jgi:hypothetical protein
VTAQFPVGIAVPNAELINARKREINKAMSQTCISAPRCTMIDMTARLTGHSDFLAPQNHLGDGVHLSKSGDDIWIQTIKTTLKKRDRG